MDGGTRLQASITLTSASNHLKDRRFNFLTNEQANNKLATRAAFSSPMNITEPGVFHAGNLPIHRKVTLVLYNHMSSTTMRTISSSLAKAHNVLRKMNWSEFLSDLAGEVKNQILLQSFPTNFDTMHFDTLPRDDAARKTTAVLAVVAKVVKHRIDENAKDKSSYVYTIAKHHPTRKGEEAATTHTQVTEKMIKDALDSTNEFLSKMPNRRFDYSFYLNQSSMREDFQDDNDLPKDSRDSGKVIPALVMFQAILSLLVFVPDNRGLDALINMLTLPGVELRVLYHLWRSTSLCAAFIKNLVLPNISTYITPPNVANKLERVFHKYLFQFQVRVLFDLIQIVNDAGGIKDDFFVSHEVLKSSPFLRHHWRSKWPLPFKDYDDFDHRLVDPTGTATINYDKDSAMKDPLLLAWIRYLPSYLTQLWESNEKNDLFPMRNIFIDNPSLIGSSGRMFPISSDGFDETSREMYGFMKPSIHLRNLYRLTLISPDISIVQGFTVGYVDYRKWSTAVVKTTEERHLQEEAKGKREKRKAATEAIYNQLDKATASYKADSMEIQDELTLLRDFYKNITTHLPDAVTRPSAKKTRKKKSDGDNNE